MTEVFFFAKSSYLKLMM